MAFLQLKCPQCVEPARNLSPVQVPITPIRAQTTLPGCKGEGKPSKRQEGSSCMERRSPKANPAGVGHKSSVFFVQGAQLVLKCPMYQLIVTSPESSCSTPALQLGQQSHLPALRLLPAPQAYSGLLVTSCKGDCLPQLGPKNPKSCLCFTRKGFYNPIAQHRSLTEQEKPFPSETVNITHDICRATKSSESIFMGFFWEISA